MSINYEAFNEMVKRAGVKPHLVETAMKFVKEYEAAKSDIGIAISEQPVESCGVICPACGESRYYSNGVCLACRPKPDKPNRFANGRYADLDLVQKVADAICKPILAKNPNFRCSGLMDATNAAIDVLEAYFRPITTKQEMVDFGSLAAHVASGLGAIKGYGHGDTAAAKSLQYVLDELMKLYEQGGRG